MCWGSGESLSHPPSLSELISLRDQGLHLPVTLRFGAPNLAPPSQIICLEFKRKHCVLQINPFILMRSNVVFVVYLFVCLLGSHCTFVLPFPFSSFLCDCSPSCFLYFVKLKCNILEVSIGSPKQILAFILNEQSKKTAYKMEAKEKRKKLFVSEVFNALRVILEENTSLFK